jgi:tRNA(fMet)-specific endonuclease VapC
MNYLLDTCTVSYFFRKDPGIIQKMQSLKPTDICLSTISVMEIEYGLQINPAIAKKLRPIWEHFQQHIEILPFSGEDAQVAAEIRAQLKNEGQPIGAYDILLAGCARNHNLIFVTANLKEFKRVKNLQVDNWQLPHQTGD